jgi:hypothetical protein
VTRRGVCAFALGLAAACAAQTRPGPSPPPHGSAAAAGQEPSDLPLLEPGSPDTPTPLAEDALWQRAGAGDPIDLQRLADREGAAGLLAGVAAGRSIGLVALAALPYSDDGELALGQLCALAARLKAGGRRAVLAAIHGVVTAMPIDRERLAAEMLRPCADKLRQIAADPGLLPEERDFAQAARAALEQHVRPEPPP